MGKLIKSQLARLIVLTAAAYQVAAAFQGFIWPKVFWDFLFKPLDKLVTPLPVLQTLNLIFGLFIIAWEWPIASLAGTSIHRSIKARLLALPVSTLIASLLYQATDPAIYYVIGTGLYFYAYKTAEVITTKPWATSLER